MGQPLPGQQLAQTQQAQQQLPQRHLLPSQPALLLRLEQQPQPALEEGEEWWPLGSQHHSLYDLLQLQLRRGARRAALRCMRTTKCCSRYRSPIPNHRPLGAALPWLQPQLLQLPRPLLRLQVGEAMQFWRPLARQAEQAQMAQQAQLAPLVGLSQLLVERLLEPSAEASADLGATTPSAAAVAEGRGAGLRLLRLRLLQRRLSKEP